MAYRISTLARRLKPCTYGCFPTRRQFTVLAIESSADDTCAAVVDSSRKIHSNIVMKQHDIHEVYGGIYPMGAIGSHQHDMPFAVRRALDEAGLDFGRDIDGVAFTRGPGMPGCLSVGMNAAKTLAAVMHKPLVGVNHMQGHALTPLLTAWPQEPKFPFLTLLISGGHTLLLLATSVTSFKILATTGDESIGRSFDKVSKLLELKWTKLGPGDALEKFCAEDQEMECPTIPPLPRPIPGRLQFSFSALHSHVKLFIEGLGGSEKLDVPMKKSIARAFQTGAVAHLEDKLILGLDWCKKENILVQSIVVSGGVASNTFLRQRLRECLVEYDRDTPYSIIFPPPHLCTDNAVMIAWAAMHRFLANDTDDYDIDLRPKWSVEEL
ncbi:Gcp-like domain-containing protein [Flammula alnicola]|nr:Gcp-like domain-containing protein [Flammula alnicola]